MPDNPYLMDETKVPTNWVDAPAKGPAGAAAPPVPHEMPQYFSGSLAPQLQLDSAFSGTEMASPMVPKHSLMPFGNQASAFTNAATQSTAIKVVQATTAPTTSSTDIESVGSNQQSGTSYTIVPGDRDTLITMTNNSGGTINLPVIGTPPPSSIFGSAVFDGTGNRFTTSLSSGMHNVAAGSLILVGASWSDGGTCAVTDTAGQTYTATGTTLYGAFDRIQFFYVLNSAAQANNVVTSTFSFGGGNNFENMAVWIFPLTGTATFDFLNPNSLANNPTTGDQTSQSFTTTKAFELTVAFNMDGGVGTGTCSFSAGWTLDSANFGTGQTNGFGAAAHRVYNSVTTDTLESIKTSGANEGGLPIIGFTGVSSAVAGTSSIGAGWFTYIQNAGSGTFALTPSTGFTIDGSSSPLNIPAGKGLMLVFDGFNWFTMRGGV